MPTSVMFVALGGMASLVAVVWMGIMAKAGKYRVLGADSDAGGNGRLEKILAETTAEIARLRERVQVLEKLVTDDDRKLAEEINRLRGDDARS